MATGKKSFIAYADWRDIFYELPNEDAGVLIKHIFAYVNDENPQSDSLLIRAVFANIKSTLKRDLNKWDNQYNQRVKAGKRSAEIRKHNATSVNERSISSTVSVSVSDSVNVNDNVNDIIIKKDSKKRFLPPTILEIEDYFFEKTNDAGLAKKESETFYNFYNAKNWMMGKNKMQVWKSAVSNWINRQKDFNKEKSFAKKESAATILQRKYGIN
jgi:hypothetical protein